MMKRENQVRKARKFKEKVNTIFANKGREVGLEFVSIDELNEIIEFFGRRDE